LERSEGPIGVFDSGLGGLSVAREIKSLMPYEDILYIGDNANVPYGPRPKEQIIALSSAISEYLIHEHAKIIVVACNTASGAALFRLRENFPEISFVGMEPAIKPAAASTHTGVIGVLATPNTFDGALYASTLHRFAEGKRVLEDPCPGLVQQIENGELDSSKTREILLRSLTPMLEADVDTIVLGCTHYPFVIPLIKEIVGEEVVLINPAPAVARQTESVLKREKTLRTDLKRIGSVKLNTTGNKAVFEGLVKRLIPQDFMGAYFDKLTWQDGKLS